MASRVVMPKLTDTMEEGVVLKWKKHEGDAVWAGEALAEIETDKAVMDLEAFASGTIRQILVKEGDTVPSGKLIAVIAEPDEDITEALTETMAPGHASNTATLQAERPSVHAAPVAEPAARAGTRTGQEQQEQAKAEIKASPRARSLARERGIDLATVKGTGPGGRITEQDLTRPAGAAPRQGRTATDKPLSQMRKAIARATTQSKAPVPHFYLTSDISMDEAERFRSQFNKTRSERVSVNGLIVKAAALALAWCPEINVSYAGDVIRQHATIDISMAVGLDDGLVSPVLRNCGTKTLLELSREAKTLVERARNRQLIPEEYTGATFTVSNLGMYDVDNFIAVLIPPEAAALAVGSVREEPVVVGSRVRLGRRMKVTLSCDHRALDGVQGAKFLKELKRILEHPLELILSDDKERRT